MKKIKLRICIMILAAVVFGLLTVFSTYYGFPGNLELMAEDGMFQQPSAIPHNYKIIAIDEETLSNSGLGPYSSWDRNYFADLINILNVDEDTKPALIAMDIQFTGTNYSASDENLVNAAKAYGNLIVATTVEFKGNTYIENGRYYRNTYIASENHPYDALAEVCDYGFSNAIFDSDGKIRRIYTKIGEYESFAYTIASKITDLPNNLNPVTEIKYTGNPGEFEIISMSQVLNGNIPGSYFDGAYVFVGAYEEGMLDAYSTPVDYSRNMYGVELQANSVYALVNSKFIYTLNLKIQCLIAFVIIVAFALVSLMGKLKHSIIMFIGVAIGFPVYTLIFFNATSIKQNILSVPLSAGTVFLITLVYRYVNIQKTRATEVQTMLFSMAEGFSEAIEGRTPYNANHTKNVARRCVEMLEYINRLHHEKKTTMSFSKADINQIYLAAMLHDIGKMDVPLEVMDKSTKLGSSEEKLRDRLSIISLKLKNDELAGRITKKEADEKLEQIQIFTDKLNDFNCGRPLSDEEWAIVDTIATSTYTDIDGEETPYLSQNEIDNLHILKGTLSENERKIMESHVEYTDKILSHMKFGAMYKDVRHMAANHHEVLNGHGYPKKLCSDELDTMTRILTIMDIYDSLIADDRPYKKPKTNQQAFDILDEEANEGKLDKDLVAIAKELYLN